jgi:hypothetical protein
VCGEVAGKDTIWVRLPGFGPGRRAHKGVLVIVCAGFNTVWVASAFGDVGDGNNRAAYGSRCSVYGVEFVPGVFAVIVWAQAAKVGIKTNSIGANCFCEHTLMSHLFLR